MKSFIMNTQNMNWKGWKIFWLATASAKGKKQRSSLSMHSSYFLNKHTCKIRGDWKERKPICQKTI